MDLSGCEQLTDIHRDKYVLFTCASCIDSFHSIRIDHITIPSKKGKGQLRRIEEVFDCWFESGR
jgi:isoleucyl-tRNA synthetase